MATLHTYPPSWSQYGGTSVQPPPKSSRVGARAVRTFIDGTGGKASVASRESYKPEGPVARLVGDPDLTRPSGGIVGETAAAARVPVEVLGRRGDVRSRHELGA